MNIGSFWVGVFAPVVLMAFGMAAVVSPLTTTVMNSAPDERSGAASGINNAASRLAGLFAVAMLGALAAVIYHSAGAPADARFGELPPIGDPARAGLEPAFLTAYAVAMALGALSSALAAATAYFGLTERDCEKSLQVTASLETN
jgi:hypothetical protein